MLYYLIVGSGYRAQYYARIASTYPTLFKALFLCRSAEKAALMKRLTGVDAVTSPDDALRFRPDFVVAAVDRGHVADVTVEWAERSFPVLAETPVGDTPEKLNALWRLHAEKGAKIVCCEQYHRYPILVAGLDAVARGLIGTPASMYLSLAHDYHAASLIRRALQTEGEGYVMRGVEAAAPVIATDSREGAILDGSAAREERRTVHVAFDSGKTAIYDFAPVQYRSFIRSRHLTVRGERGEWSDRIVYHLDDENRPLRTFLMPELPPAYRCLDTQTLRDGRKVWQPELFLDTAQDEFAIASLLLDMGDYLAGGPEPYPLREALDDARFWLLMERAAASPWRDVRPEPAPWRA